MSDLHRTLAPLSGGAWAHLEREARDALSVYVAARKLVTFSGPHGWDTASVTTGRVRDVDALGDGVSAKVRVVQPLVELRIPFTLDRRELETIERGNPKPDLDPMIDAAKRIALAEDRLVFDGSPGAGVIGITPGAGQPPVSLDADYLKYPESVVTALQQLRDAGVGGPYGIALGPRCFTGLMTTVTAGGYPVYKHVRELVEGPIVHARALDGAVVMAMEGGGLRARRRPRHLDRLPEPRRRHGHAVLRGEPDLPAARARRRGLAEVRLTRTRSADVLAGRGLCG